MTEPLQEILSTYTRVKVLSDGRICGIHRLMFHWTIHVDIHEWGYEDRYCFETFDLADEALEKYQGDEMINWHRHPKTGRRRNLKTGEEWIAW